METLTVQKSVFDMSPEELEEHLRPTAQRIKKEALDMGSWFPYRNELCIEPDMFIHEFKDGRKELIKLGNQTGEFKVLATFR